MQRTNLMQRTNPMQRTNFMQRNSPEQVQVTPQWDINSVQKESVPLPRLPYQKGLPSQKGATMGGPNEFGFSGLTR